MIGSIESFLRGIADIPGCSHFAFFLLTTHSCMQLVSFQNHANKADIVFDNCVIKADNNN